MIGDDLRNHTQYTAERTLQRLDGITDEEFRWQPAPNAWTVRQLRSGRTVLDNNNVQPPPAPVTSIAWKVAHLIDIYGSPRNSKWLRVEPPTPPIPNSPWTIAWTAGESIAVLRAAVEHFTAVVAAVAESAWMEPLGPGCEPWQDESLAAFVLHQVDEAIHHAAEVGTLRDLYFWQHATPPAEPATVLEAATAGRWDLVESLTLDGGDVNGGSPSALHLAASIGDLEMVRLLVEHGADTKAKDEMFNGSPSFWASYFGHDGIVEFLRSR